MTFALIWINSCFYHSYIGRKIASLSYLLIIYIENVVL